MNSYFAQKTNYQKQAHVLKKLYFIDHSSSIFVGVLSFDDNVRLFCLDFNNDAIHYFWVSRSVSLYSLSLILLYSRLIHLLIQFSVHNQWSLCSSYCHCVG